MARDKWVGQKWHGVDIIFMPYEKLIEENNYT